MNQSNKQLLQVIQGGRDELERRLVKTFFTPFLPDNELVAQHLVEQLSPRINRASLTLISREPPCRSLHHPDAD